MIRLQQKTYGYSQMQKISLSGFAGGLTEVLWIIVISLLLDVHGADIAREVTASVLPNLRNESYAIALGIAIHLALSVVLAAAYIWSIGTMTDKRMGIAGQLITGMSVLALVWAVNFLLILPQVNPIFSDHISYGLSLISKMLFGLSMALVIHYLSQRRSRASV